MKHADTINQPNAIPEYIEPEWVDTPTSTQIRTGLIHVQTTPTIGLFHSGAGRGKTHSARRLWVENAIKSKDGFSRQRPTVYMVTAHPGMSTVASVLCAIGEEMGHFGNAYRNDTMTKQILRTLVPGDLLIIDEAQHLDIRALDQIRHFHDVGGIGVAYLGNEEIHTRINGRGRQAAFLGPLASRVGMRLSVPNPTEKDVAAILEAWNVHGQDENDYALGIAVSSIGLRGLTQVLRQAAIIAKDMNRLLDSRAMRTAAANLGFN